MYRSCLLWLVDSVFSGLCQRNWTLFCPTGLHYTRYTNNLFRPFLYLQALPAHSEIIVALSAHNLTRQHFFMFDNGSRKGYYFIHQPTYVTLNSILSRHRTKYLDNNFVFKRHLVLNSQDIAKRIMYLISSVLKLSKFK